MNLQEKAQHTINVEYPGKTLADAKYAADERALEMMAAIGAAEEALQEAQFALDEAIQAYHDADRASSLFQNALDEEAI